MAPPDMRGPLALATEFNRYFTSSNRVDVGERVSVPRDEWRTLMAAIERFAKGAMRPAPTAACITEAQIAAGAAVLDTKASPSVAMSRSMCSRRCVVPLNLQRQTQGRPPLCAHSSA